jgi:hypothetical protein
MKKVFVILVALSLSLVISCEKAGITRERLAGNENELPDELKGLKVYDVSIGNGSSVKVAVMDNQVLGNTYKSGKHTSSIVMVHKNQNRVINVESIISENDSIMVIKKLR